MSEDPTLKPSDEETGLSDGFLALIYKEIVGSYLNIFLLTVCFCMLIKIILASRKQIVIEKPDSNPLPKLAKQDITIEQLKQYDGSDPTKSICIAVNGKVFDVTRGKKFYGPDGPYNAFAGHDASRALATFSVNDVKKEFDDLSDLSSEQMESVREWEMQFYEKYDYVGRLLKPGEQPGDYSEDDENKDKEGKEHSENNSVKKRATIPTTVEEENI